MSIIFEILSFDIPPNDYPSSLLFAHPGQQEHPSRPQVSGHSRRQHLFRNNSQSWGTPNKSRRQSAAAFPPPGQEQSFFWLNHKSPVQWCGIHPFAKHILLVKNQGVSIRRMDSYSSTVISTGSPAARPTGRIPARQASNKFFCV